MSKMFQGFKDFIMRGNVVDLAVGIVIGAAFTTVVTKFTDAFIKPLIQLASGGKGVNAGTATVRGVVFDYSSFINAVITFLITAAVLYFLVVFPLNALAERRRRGEEPPPKAPAEDIVLLTQIRDALIGGEHLTAVQHKVVDDTAAAQRREIDEAAERRPEPPR
jgi:large conductance mechanosensitive channel